MPYDGVRLRVRAKTHKGACAWALTVLGSMSFSMAFDRSGAFLTQDGPRALTLRGAL